MFGGKKKEAEVFEKAYVKKDSLGYVQIHPVPEDLDNWIEIDFDPEFSYINKVYDISTKKFKENKPALDKIKLGKRKEAYKERSDPLFIEWQYDQTLEAEKAWRDEVAAIKAENPIN